jgi:hypothetical protein
MTTRGAPVFDKAMVPAWPVISIELSGDGSVRVDGAEIFVAAEQHPRAVALNVAGETARVLGRPVRVEAIEPDGTVFPLIVAPDGEVRGAGDPVPVPVKRRKLIGRRKAREQDRAGAAAARAAAPPASHEGPAAAYPGPSEGTPVASGPGTVPAIPHAPSAPAPRHPSAVPAPPPAPQEPTERFAVPATTYGAPEPARPAPTPPRLESEPVPAHVTPAVPSFPPTVGVTPEPPPVGVTPEPPPVGVAPEPPENRDTHEETDRTPDGEGVSEIEFAHADIPDVQPSWQLLDSAREHREPPAFVGPPREEEPLAFPPPGGTPSSGLPNEEQARQVTEIARSLSTGRPEQALALAASLEQAVVRTRDQEALSAAREVHAYVAARTGSHELAVRLYLAAASTEGVVVEDATVTDLRNNARYCWLRVQDPESAYHLGELLLREYATAPADRADVQAVRRHMRFLHDILARS